MSKRKRISLRDHLGDHYIILSSDQNLNCNRITDMKSIEKGDA